MTMAAQPSPGFRSKRAAPPPTLAKGRPVVSQNVRRMKAALPALSARVKTRSEHKAALRQKKSVSVQNRGRVLPDRSLWETSGRLGGKLTPQDVSAIIRAADSGNLTALMDLANECRQKDCHLSAVLSVGEESIAGLQWKLVLPENARAKDKRAMKWAEGVLRQLPALRKLIAYLAGARYYGFDVNEILWRKDQGKMIPADFAHLGHRRFGYDPVSGNFVLRDVGMPYEGEDFRAKWPNKFITSHPRANGDAAQREGLCRPLIWMTQFRVWSISDWLRTAELSWKPWRIGTYKKDRADTEDEEALEMILKKLSTTGWAAKPDSMDIDIEWPAGTQSTKGTHNELANTLANEMSKAYLGQTETVQSSAGSGYAQAKVHDDVRRDIREAAAMQIAADLTRDLLTPLIQLNFSGVAVPAFEFITQDPVDLKAFAEAVKALADSKLRIPVKWIRDNAGMPEPKEGEECLNEEPEEEDPLDPDADPNAKPEDGKEPDGEELPDPEEDDAEEPAAAKPKKSRKSRR